MNTLNKYRLLLHEFMNNESRITNVYWSISGLCIIGVVMMFFMPQRLAPREYNNWTTNPENRLIRSQKSGDLKAQLQYRPIDQIIAAENANDQLCSDFYKTRRKELEGSQYYNLKLSVGDHPKLNVVNYNVGDLTASQERIYYLSYQMQDDIKLIQEGDTISPALYHFERSYDLARHRSFVMAFPEPKDPRAERTFIFDSEIFSPVPLKVHFNKSDFSQIPSIKHTSCN